jgi:WD40 repeat protein
MIIRERCFVWCVFLFSSYIVRSVQSDIKQQQHDNFGQMMFQRCKIAKHVVFTRDGKSAKGTAEWNGFPDELWEKVFVFFKGEWKCKGKPIHAINTPRALAFCPPHYIAVAGDNGKPGICAPSFGRNIYFYNLETGDRCGEIVRIKTCYDWCYKRGVTSLASLTNNKIAAGTRDYPFNIEIWSTQTGKLEKELSGNDSWVSALTVASSGELVAGYANGMITFWNVDKGICVNKFRAFEYPASCMENMASAPGKKVLKFPQKIKVLAVINNKLIARSPFCLRGWNLNAMEDDLESRYSMEQCVVLWNNMIAVGHKAHNTNSSATIEILGCGNHDDIRAHSQGHISRSARVIALAASPDKTVLASAGTDGVIKTWEYIFNCGYTTHTLQPSSTHVGEPSSDKEDSEAEEEHDLSDEKESYLSQLITMSRQVQRLTRRTERVELRMRQAFQDMGQAFALLRFILWIRD